MKRMSKALIGILGLTMAFAAHAETKLKPFILAYTTTGDMATVVKQVEKKLTDGGFQVVGSYVPYPNATVIAVTNAAEKAAAARTKFGAYGAAQRVSVTNVNGQLQVAYTNPVYMANAYRMKGDMSDVKADLVKALGEKEAYGAKEGMSASDLRDYHYMFGMEYFTDPTLLATYESYEDALKGVNAHLAKGTAGVTKVYEVDIPGAQQAEFGVAMKGSGKNKYMSDAFIMNEIDFKPIRSTPHLPYEMVVSGNKVYALYARFRIAVNFPDLSMMGSHSFMGIVKSPKAIARALIQAAGGKLTAEYW